MLLAPGTAHVPYYEPSEVFNPLLAEALAAGLAGLTTAPEDGLVAQRDGDDDASPCPGSCRDCNHVGSARMAFELAQVNVARLRAPLDSVALAGFVAALDPVNASADAAVGFVWRLQADDGNATSIRAFDWDTGDSAGVIVNMSVWESIESLADWVYGEMHRQVLRQRRQWFHHLDEATTALWWVPSGHRPGTDEAEDRVRRLRAQGPSPAAFTFRQTFTPSATTGTDGAESPPERLCPAAP